MDTSHDYEVRLNWLSARMGVVSSPDLEERIVVATPPEFPGGVSGIWSPEHLFVAAISSCFMTTFLSIAEKSRLNFKGFTCAATGKLELVDKAYLMTEVVLKPHLIITRLEDQDKALQLLHKSEKHCLISNSVNSKISVEPVVTIEAMTSAL